MGVAIWFVVIPHGTAFVNDARGAASYEKPLAYLVMALVLVLLGLRAFALNAACRPKRGRRR